MNNKKSISKSELEEMLKDIYDALFEKGYDPVSQIAGYILSEDPLYIPDWNNARGLVRHIDRDDLLRLIIEYYLENKFVEPTNEKSQ